METWMTNFHGLLTLDNKLLQTDVSCLSVWKLHFVPQTFHALLSHYCVSRMRRRPVSWSSSSPRSATTLLFTPKNTTRNFSHIFHALSRLSGTCWFLLGRRSSTTWWGQRRFIFLFLFWRHFSVHWPTHVTLVSARKQRNSVPGFSLWTATLQTSVWGPEHAHKHLWEGHCAQHGV